MTFTQNNNNQPIHDKRMFLLVICNSILQLAGLLYGMTTLTLSSCVTYLVFEIIFLSNGIISFSNSVVHLLLFYLQQLVIIMFCCISISYSFYVNSKDSINSLKYFPQPCQARQISLHKCRLRNTNLYLQVVCPSFAIVDNLDYSVIV